jgi:hypothetical protein
MTDLDRAFGPEPRDMGPPINSEASESAAEGWHHAVALGWGYVSSGSRPHALEAQIACSFCPGLDGEHVKNCLLPEKSRVTRD